MTTPLLVITSDAPFGDHICQKLEETGNFAVCVTGDQAAAAVYGREFSPALAFLDTSLGESELLRIGAILRQANPEIVFIVISESGWHSALEELFPRDYLAKPFYLPDLLEMMAKIFHLPVASEPVSLNEKLGLNNDLPWLMDVTRAAQHLTRLTLESSAQAALITRLDRLWAYAGQLPQSAARELAVTLARYWDHEEENDLVRFVKLTSTDAEHMLYATRLAEGMVLALVFDAETPFSTIRSQASNLVHSLSSSPEPPDEDLDASAADLSQPPASGAPLGSVDDLRLTKMRSRDSRRRADMFPDEGSTYSRGDPAPEIRINPLVVTDESLADTRKSRRSVSTEIVQETAQRPAIEVARKIVLEPVSAAVYNLDYACLLVPRFPHHHMTGDLLDRLGEWVPQVCIAFAFRLEYISVRPDYLQWIVNVPPATSPAYLMRVLRQHTSENIFNEFPRYKKDNPSGDFWAPGYLIMGGSQPHPAQLIKDFIAQTRQRQGFPLNINR
jgi:REP element-mobilizing transposase RayT